MLTFGGHFENCGRQVQEQGLVPSWDSPKFGKTSVDPIACKVQCRGRSERLRSARVGIFFGAGSLCSWAVLSISSRSLCPGPPFLLCSPNQNRHATQAWGLATCRPIHLQPKPRAAKTIESKNRSVEKDLWHPVFTMA